MKPHASDPDMTRPSQNGVYFVGVDDLGRLAASAVRDELCVCHIDLAECRDRDELLRRMDRALQLPASFGHNWDALADCLRDLGWLPAWGHVLLFEHADELRRSGQAEFDTLLGILDDAATFGSEHERPWFAFLALPEEAFEHRRAMPRVVSR